jgi:hypothetical protein
MSVSGGVVKVPSYFGKLAADVNLASGATTPIMTTTVLPSGLYLFTFTASVGMPQDAVTVDIQVVPGTAAATFLGPNALEVYGYTNDRLTIVTGVDITSPGTLVVEGVSGTTATLATVLHLTGQSGQSSTGWSALRIE